MKTSSYFLQVLILVFLLASSYLSGGEDISQVLKNDDEIEGGGPPKIGNFALPSSQQTSSLLCFGGNVIDGGEVQIALFGSVFNGKNIKAIDLNPSILVGMSDEWSLFFNFPFTPLLEEFDHSSKGLQDFYIQSEYAFYSKTTVDYDNQATIVAGATFPTGSIKKNPTTGFGSPSFFLGDTFYHTRIEWMFFLAPGVEITTTGKHRTKFGNQFFYQGGFGRNVTSPEGWIYAGILEFQGQYNEKNRINGHVDQDSGGHAVFATPSIWISSEELVAQLGVSFPVYQNPFGQQARVDYIINFNFAWSFY